MSDRAGFSIDTIAGRTIHPDGTIVAFAGKPYEKMIEKGKDYQVQGEGVYAAGGGGGKHPGVPLQAAV